MAEKKADKAKKETKDTKEIKDTIDIKDLPTVEKATAKKRLLEDEPARRLSDLSTDEVVGVLLAIAPEINAIMEDTELKEIWASREEPKDEGEAKSFGKAFALKAGTHLLQHHKGVVYAILGAVNGKKQSEIAKQPFYTTVFQIVALTTDGDLYSFFIYLMQLVQGV